MCPVPICSHSPTSDHVSKAGNDIGLRISTSSQEEEGKIHVVGSILVQEEIGFVPNLSMLQCINASWKITSLTMPQKVNYLSLLR
ncbi:hypothetical protein V6N13_104724 [Hibiscus sabdariffa]